jgi:acyl carrier protein phosphodiesterase
MLLSGDDHHLLIGNFMGDFVKGPLAERFPPRIRQGVALHRSIDSYAGRDELFRRSRLRISPGYGLYRGVLVDLFYDHFLVREWERWSTEPFASFLTRTRSLIEEQRHELPERMQGLIPVIFDELLPSYGETSGIASALVRMSRRVRRANPLAGGEAELLLHRDGLRDDFRQFMPGIQRHVEEYLQPL